MLISGLNYRNTRQLNEDVREVAHTLDVLGLTSDVMLGLVDAEPGQRGFLITSKDEFLATLAHELRNPLAPIRNGLQLMKLVGGQDPTIEQARSMMERQLTQMVRLVDDLMDLNRISRGKIELKKERVQLAAIVKSAVETSRPLIEEMGHKLTVMLTEHPIIVDADLTRLALVFLNLLNNAAKYSDREGHITLAVERQGSDVLVSVRDYRVPIDEDGIAEVYIFTGF